MDIRRGRPARRRNGARRFIGREHVSQPEAARVVEVSVSCLGMDAQHALDEPLRPAWIRHARGIGERDAVDPDIEIALDDIEHRPRRLRPSNGQPNAVATVALTDAPPAWAGLTISPSDASDAAAHAHVRAVVRLARRHHEIEFVGVCGQRAARRPSVRDQRRRRSCRAAARCREDVRRRRAATGTPPRHERARLDALKPIAES